jgi:biopolymer transport protein ExbB/TolQ
MAKNTNSITLNMPFDRQTRTIAISALLSLAIAIISYTALQMLGGPKAQGILVRLLILIGADIVNGGYIQILTYFAFFWGMFDIVHRLKGLRFQRQAFHENLLPTAEKHLLLPNDMRDLYHNTKQYEKSHAHYLLTDLILKACLKFRSSKSIPEVIEIISIQIEINKEKSEGRQSTIRYMTWVIPSIGFIGTVIGISQSLMLANSGDMEAITAALGVAFDTTLIALVLSVIIMWYFHKLQEYTDSFHADAREYLMSNLVNRIEM